MSDPEVSWVPLLRSPQQVRGLRYGDVLRGGIGDPQQAQRGGKLLLNLGGSQQIVHGLAIAVFPSIPKPFPPIIAIGGTSHGQQMPPLLVLSQSLETRPVVQ